MKHKSLLILVFCFSFANVLFAEPQNLAKAKEKVMHYVEQGGYRADMEKAYGRAKQYLLERIQAHQEMATPTKKLAVVLDIDETILSNYREIKYRNFGGSQKTIIRAMARGNAEVIPAALNFVNYAKDNGVAVFFITGRSESLRKATELNLNDVGVKGWKAVYMKPNDYKEKSIVHFKASVRSEIEAKGYIVVESIGDQWSDIRGHYAEKGIKLPNPFYLVL